MHWTVKLGLVLMFGPFAFVFGALFYVIYLYATRWGLGPLEWGAIGCLATVCVGASLFWWGLTK